MRRLARYERHLARTRRHPTRSADLIAARSLAENGGNNQPTVKRMSASREQQAREWLDTNMPGASGSLVLLAGDASFRRYFRVTDTTGRSLVLMDAPPAKENCEPFLRIARHWHQRGVPVPAIIADDLEQGFLLLEDFGDMTLMRQIGDGDPDGLYRHCIDVLLELQELTDTPGLPDYDEGLLRREMALFTDWLVASYLGLSLPEHLAALMQQWFDELVAAALAQPRVAVHRDYHSRNLMVPRGRQLGILDFQDAVLGPYTYDLVSLLKDCYVRWPDAQVTAWTRHCHERLPASRRTGRDFATFEQDVRVMGMQRHLKAAGIFARLWLRDGKPGYLQDIPNTVRYIVEALDHLPAYQPLQDWFRGTLQPRLAERLAEGNQR